MLAAVEAETIDGTAGTGLANWWLHHGHTLKYCLTVHHCSDFKYTPYQTPLPGRRAGGSTGVQRVSRLILGMWCYLQCARAPSQARVVGGAHWALGWGTLLPPCSSLSLQPAARGRITMPTVFYPQNRIVLLQIANDLWNSSPASRKAIWCNFWNPLPLPVFPCFFPLMMFYSKEGIFAQGVTTHLQCFLYVLSYPAVPQAAHWRMQWYRKEQEPEIHLGELMQTPPPLSVRAQSKFKSTYRKGSRKNKSEKL